MVCTLLALILVFSPGGQAAGPLQTSDWLTAAERSLLEREDSIEDRIRIYELASTRIHRSMRNSILRQEVASLSGEFESWLQLLSEAARDIEKNVSRKKKSKNLIRFEIHLRKALGDIKGLKLQLTADVQDRVDNWLSRAEQVRRKFVDVLFLS